MRKSTTPESIRDRIFSLTRNGARNRIFSLPESRSSRMQHLGESARQAVEAIHNENGRHLDDLVFHSDDGHSVQTMSTSYTTAPRNDGLWGLITCLRMIKDTRWAKVQCIWLTICTLFFSYFVMFHWTKAREASTIGFKSEKSRVVNYAREDEEYQMPNFSLIVSGSEDSSVMAEQLQLLANKSKFECLYLKNLNNSFGLAKNISIISIESHSLWRLLIAPENPEPGMGPWYCTWKFKSMSFTRTVFFVGQSANDTMDGSYKLMQLPLLNGKTSVISIDYSQTVRESFRWGTVYEFVTSINEIQVPSSTTDFNVELWITMHPVVSYWQEYEEFSAQDVLSSLGGVFSVVSLVYFWVAYYIAYTLGHHSYHMGILPFMSFTFSNLEYILFIKERLEHTHIVRKGRWFSHPMRTAREKELSSRDKERHYSPSLTLTLRNLKSSETLGK